MDKFPKQSVGYTHAENTNYTCPDCVFNVSKGQCAVLGRAGTISEFGGSNFFIFSPPNDRAREKMPYVGPLTKNEIGYVENKPGFSCKRCEYFVGGTAMDCKKVDKDSPGDDPGMIHPDACCNRWEKDGMRRSYGETGK
jgi:hypothetical protein